MRLTFRKKALLLILPILGLVSMAYTYDAIKTEKEIVRTEIIKRAEAITTLGTKTGELPLLSGNPDLLGGTVSSLRANPEVISVAFFDNKMNLLVKDGPPVPGRLPVLSASYPISMSDEKNELVFYAPVFTVRAGDDIDIFHEGTNSRQVREHIGWLRLVFSKAAMNEAVGKVVTRGVVLAGIFTIGSSIAVFLLITIATKPLMILFDAAKKIEKGEYPVVGNISSNDEIGELASAFNRMSLSIKERELRLVESENRIRKLFERVEHAIFRLDKNGAIIEANSKFRDLFGEAEMFRDILDGGDAVRRCFDEASSGSAFHWEEKAVGRDGRELVILLSLYPEIADDGSAEGYDGYIIDVTEKKRLEERLLRSQKLEAVGTLAGGIAHDFNNLLQAILGYSEMLMDMAREGDLLSGPLKIINDAAKRGADLTKKILSVARKEKMEIQNVDLNEILRNSVELLRRSIPKNIEIVTAFGDIPTIKADPSQMQQMILNLAINARDAMIEGGLLTVASELGEGGGAAGAMPPRTSEYVKLSVSDTGTGISRGTESRIFDPFFTTKDAGRGTGLGLYMVHAVVSNHGGHINVYSEPGKGTVFQVYLPLAKGDPSGESPPAAETGGSETILVIDDEFAVREACRDMLSPLGYEIMLADGGKEGIEIYGQMKDRISLVLLDMIMPETSGNEVFEAIKAINPEVKILLCSGYSQDGYADIDKLLKTGANGFVQKPFTRQRAALAIREALRG